MKCSEIDASFDKYVRIIPASLYREVFPSYLTFPRKDFTLKAVEALLEKLSMLSLPKLSELQRRVIIIEIKSHLDHFVPEDDPEEAWLSHRVKLLGYWHELVKLRLADVRANVEPPVTPVKLEPLLTLVEEPAPLDLPDAEDHKHSGEDEHLPDDHGKDQHADVPEAHTPPPRAEGQEEWVDIILTEPGVIRGMQLPAGITVTVSPEDGDEIVERFKGKYVTTKINPDQPQE